MYDKYSLKNLLNDNGYKNIEFFDHKTSKIPGFNSYYLDTEQDGTPYKGCSSIYCEAIVDLQ